MVPVSPFARPAKHLADVNKHRERLNRTSVVRSVARVSRSLPGVSVRECLAPSRFAPVKSEKIVHVCIYISEAPNYVYRAIDRDGWLFALNVRYEWRYRKWHRHRYQWNYDSRIPSNRYEWRHNRFLAVAIEDASWSEKLPAFRVFYSSKSYIMCKFIPGVTELYITRL